MQACFKKSLNAKSLVALSTKLKLLEMIFIGNALLISDKMLSTAFSQDKQIIQLIVNYDVILFLKRVEFVEIRKSVAGFRLSKKPRSSVKQ